MFSGYSLIETMLLFLVKIVPARNKKSRQLIEETTVKEAVKKKNLPKMSKVKFFIKFLYLHLQNSYKIYAYVTVANLQVI